MTGPLIYLKTLAYILVVGLDWCLLSRHAKNLTVSLTQMAKLIEIKKVPMKILPNLTVKTLGRDYGRRLLLMQHSAMIDQ